LIDHLKVHQISFQYQ